VILDNAIAPPWVPAIMPRIVCATIARTGGNYRVQYAAIRENDGGQIKEQQSLDNAAEATVHDTEIPPGINAK